MSEQRNPRKQLRSKRLENSLRANVIDVIPADVKTLACRAVWRVTADDVKLAKTLISSKRLTLDDMLANISGVQYFFSCITIMISNAKSSSCQTGNAQSHRESYPGVAYFVAYRCNEVCNENAIFASFHNADMEPTISKLRTTSSASSLFQILKDHSCDIVRHLVTTSNMYCYQRAVLELENEGNRLESTSHSFSSKPCRIVVVNESEMLQKMTKAFDRLQSDGLVADLVAIPNPEEVILPTNESDLTKTIRDIDRIMQLCDHALYRGDVYARPNLAIFTFSHMMDVDSYLHHLLSNDSVLKHFTVLSKTLGHNDCTIIQQIQFENDLIEVLDGVVLKISSRRFISCPIAEESRRKISPRIFVPYDSTVTPHAGYFKEGILNSFRDLEERINFLNKFYQCLVVVVGKMPQKVRKLVVVGPRDSGKTSWSAIFHRIIPAQRIATITKENQFSAAMMDDFTQIVLIDEWSGWCMESSLAKTLLQGVG